MQHSNPGPDQRFTQWQPNQEDYMQHGRANNGSYEQNYPQNPGRGYNRPPRQNYSEDYMPRSRGNNRHYEQNNPYNPAPYGRGHRPYQQNYSQNPGRGYNRPHQQNNSWGYGSSGRRYNDKKDDVYISKCLSTILRHTAEKLHLKFDSEGYLYVKDLLSLERLHGVTTNDVLRIVKENDKQRFSVKNEEDTENLMIRANQGHSIKFENLNVGLKPIDDPEDYPIVLHGTYYCNWESIQKEGLKRMSRVHIHFAAGLPGENGVISGMRKSCEIIIHLNLKKAIEDGLKFFLSVNNVILSSGDEHGIIAPKYFDKVFDAKLGSLVSFISEGPVCQKKKNLPIGMSPVDDNDKNERTKKKNKEHKKKKSKHSPEKSSDSPASKSHKRDSVTLEDESDFEKKKKTEPEIDKELSAPDHWDSTEEPESPSEDVSEEGPTPQEQLNLCPSEKDEPKSKNENESKKSKKKKANKDKTSSEDVKPSIENKMDAKSEGQKNPEKLKDKKKSTEETRDSSEENPLENVKSSYENKMDAGSEVQKEPEKKKEKKPTKKATEETSDSSEVYPLVIFIIIEENEPDEKLMAQLREEKLIGINVLKKASDITHFLITTVDNVFIFDVGTMKKYLKKSLEDIHCTKVMFNSSLVSELYKQMGISMYKTPIADIKILAEKHHKKKFMQFSELIKEHFGKIPPPEHDVRYEKIAKQSCGKAKTVMKNLAQVAKMLSFFEIYKSSMDEIMKAAIFENYDKDFDEETRAKLTRFYEKKASGRPRSRSSSRKRGKNKQQQQLEEKKQ